MQQTLWRRIAVLALPVALQTLLQALLGMADVVMVTGLGANAVAAVGLAAKLHFLLLVMAMGIAASSSILIAQHYGAGNLLNCQRTLAIALYWGTLITLPSVVVFLLGAYWLGWINPDPEVVRLAAVYLLITAPALLLTQYIAVYEAALRATGNAIMPLVVGAGAVLSNVFFNYVLIFGHFGFPALGVEGAAWGTLISRMLQLLTILAWLSWSKHLFALSTAYVGFLRDKAAMRYFLSFSFPVMLNHALWAVGNSTYHIATGFAGTEALAVMGVMVPIESAFFALFVGLASAAAVMVGQSLGADDQKQAQQLYRLFNRTAVVLVVVLAGTLWLLRSWIPSVFGGLDATTVSMLMQTLAIFCLGVWVKILNMLRILGILRAGGDTRFCLITDTIVMWGAGVPLFLLAVWLGAPFLVLYGLMFLEDFLKWIPVKRRIKRGIWLRNLTVEDAASGAT
ncbi:MAG: MATE family efflux transporter [Cellvibrionaceae bacterium]|nr:MATE family efflux transporter [Cellvibrionaceae bacterium]